MNSKKTATISKELEAYLEQEAKNKDLQSRLQRVDGREWITEKSPRHHMCDFCLYTFTYGGKQV